MIKNHVRLEYILAFPKRINIHSFKLIKEKTNKLVIFKERKKKA